MRRTFSPCGLILAILTVGCGPEVRKITGLVLQDGEPRPKTALVFWPVEDLHAGMFVCPENNEDGSFTIYPDETRGEGRAGRYRVAFGDTELDPLAMMAMLQLRKQVPGWQLPGFGRCLPPPRYLSAETSPEIVSIQRGVNELPSFDLHD